MGRGGTSKARFGRSLAGPLVRLMEPMVVLLLLPLIPSSLEGKGLLSPLCGLNTKGLMRKAP